MFKKVHVEFKHVEKLACSFQCMSKKLHCEKCAGRTTTFHYFSTDKVVGLPNKVRRDAQEVPSHGTEFE